MRTRGFSFTELLVSLSIMALLAALLTPVGLSAWQAFHLTQCKWNLATLYQAQALWRADNEHSLLTGSRWMAYLLPYLEGDTTILHCPTRAAWGYTVSTVEDGSSGSGGGDHPWLPATDKPDVGFEFDVYLQVGSAGPGPGQGSGSHMRGPFSHTIPLGNHPWVMRTDHDSYTNYKIDDDGGMGSPAPTYDDLELNSHHDENGDPIKVDIIRARGADSASVVRRFIFDFKICGEVVIPDWAGQEAPDFNSHYGEAIDIEYGDDGGSGAGSQGGWLPAGGGGWGIQVVDGKVIISGGLQRYYGDYALNYGTYARRDESLVTGVDGKRIYILDYGGWDPVADFNQGGAQDDEWDKYFIWSPRGQADAVANWEQRYGDEAGHWKAWQSLRHFGRANVLFCDGHIDTLGPQELDYLNPLWAYSGRGAPVPSPAPSAAPVPPARFAERPVPGPGGDLGGALHGGGLAGGEGPYGGSGRADSDPEAEPVGGRWVNGKPGDAIGVTLYWSCVGNADVYLNGKPLRRYEPGFRTRPAAPLREFSAPAVLRRGDVITVGARRWQPSGVLLVAVDRAGNVVWKTDEATWEAYFPADERRWWLPEVAQRSVTVPVVAQPHLWPVQARLNRRFNGVAEAIWHEEMPLAFFVSVIE